MTTLAPPKWRSDLTVSPQPTAKGTVFVVKDPLTGDFFRFGETEWFIAEQIDGATPVEAIRQRAEEQFGAPLSAEALNRFIQNLAAAGLLENGQAGRKRRGLGRRRRIRGSLLHLRFPVCDPDRLFGRLAARMRLLFTRQFMIVSAVFILGALTVAISNWEIYQGDIPRLYRLSAIPLIALTLFGIITAHEFAHGLTCKHFGGEVRELGIMLIYFQPAAYCNVSDAWLFPEKARRLLVAFAGPYFELFVWSLATLIWRLTDVETWINYLALIAMTTSGIKTLFNFNPLIKLDGYYLLSDYLEIPNLRRKAFRYIGHRLKRLFGLAVQPSGVLTRRERRIYLAYGSVAGIFSIALLGFVTARLGGFLIEQNQPAALALLAGLVGTKFRRRFGKLFGNSPTPSESPDDVDSPAGASAQDRLDPSPQTDSPEPPRRRNRKRFGAARAVKILLLAAVAAPILFLGKMELKVRGAFDVLPIHNADVRAEVEGIVEEICVDEGDVVRAGDVIARLSDRAVRAELRKTEAEIAQIRARLRMLEAGPTAEEVAVARATVAKMEDRLSYARNALTRDKALFEQKLLSRMDFEATEEQVASAENELNEARGRLQVLLRGTRPEEIDGTKAEIARLETQRRFLEEQMELSKVASPITGIVATPSLQLREMKHQLVTKGALIAKVYDCKTVTAQIVVSEKDIADVQAGRRVLLKARAYPDQLFQGTVTAIATTAQLNPASTSSASTGAPPQSRGSGTPKMVRVTTEIENPSFLLKPEMTGQAKILCGQRRIFDLLTRRLARTLKVEFWSWW